MDVEQNFFELIAARESCRSYDVNRLPEKTKLQKCLEAARIAPSACNSQPWQLMAVTDNTLVKQLSEATGQKFSSTVPAFIAVTELPATLNPRIREMYDCQHFAQIDIGIVTAHICLAATAQGLSTCIMGAFDEEKASRLLGVEQGRLRLLIAVGYAATDKPRDKQRKQLAEISAFIE